MRKKIFQWLDREFVALSAEGTEGKTADEQMENILRRFERELRDVGLSLDDTVRSTLWARDLECRLLGSNARFKVLAGKARSSSTSFVSHTQLDSDVLVGLDLLALRPSRPDAEKRSVEYEPLMRPCRYVVSDRIAFLTGEESEVGLNPPVLAEQVANILSVLGESLKHAGTSWDRAVLVGCFLKRTESLDELKALLTSHLGSPLPPTEYRLVDDYAPQAVGTGILEVEVTATLG